MNQLNKKEVQIHIRLQPEVGRELKTRCVIQRCSVQSFVEKLINANVMQKPLGKAIHEGQEKKTAIVKLLVKCSFLDDLSQLEIEHLAEAANIFRFNKGKIIIHAGQFPQYFYLIKTGLVKVFRSTLLGKEFIVDISHDGEQIGTLSLLRGKLYSSTIQSLTYTEIISIDKKIFTDTINKHPETILKITNMASTRAQRLHERSVELLFGSADQRISKILFFLTEEFGSILHFNQKIIADMVGITTESTSRILGKMQRRNLIRLTRGSINILDKEGLLLYP